MSITVSGGGGGGGGGGPTTASGVSFAPIGNTASTNVQAAIEETRSELDATIISAQAFSIARANHTGTQSADTLTDGTTNKAFLATERTKLAGIAAAATANSPDATLLNRANHTGTQAVGTITGLNAGVVPFTPTGATTSTDVQNAIVEVRSELQTLIDSITVGFDPTLSPVPTIVIAPGAASVTGLGVADDTTAIVNLINGIPRGDTALGSSQAGCAIFIKKGRYKVQPNKLIFEVAGTDVYFEPGCTFLTSTAGGAVNPGDRIFWIGNSDVNFHGQLVVIGPGSKGNGIAVALGPTSPNRYPASPTAINSGVHSCVVNAIKASNCETSIDFGISDQITISATASTSGGTLAAGAKFYKVTAFVAGVEYAVSTEKSITTTGSTSSVTLNWNSVVGATSYRVYRGTATNAENTYYALGNVLTYIDTGSAGTAGTVPTGIQSGDSSGDNVARDIRASNCLIGARSRGFVNSIDGGFISGCDYGVHVTTDRTSARLIVRDLTINNSAQAPYLIEGGGGTTVYNTWIEQTSTKAARAAIAVIGAVGQDVMGCQFIGDTNLHANKATPEDYAFKLYDNAHAFIDQVSVSINGGIPAVATVRQEPSFDGEFQIGRISFKGTIPTGWNAVPLVSVGGGSTGEVLIGEVPGADGAQTGTVVPYDKFVRVKHATGLIDPLLIPAPSANSISEAMLDSSVQGKLNAVGGAGATQGPDFVIKVTGSPNSATYTATSRAGVTTTATDSSTVSGLRTVLTAIVTDNIHIHFSSGRFHFIDSLTGTDSWANTQTGFGISQKRGITFTGEGMDVTIISNRSNTITASPDLALLLFTNCTECDIRDMTFEFCGAYQATMESVNCNQGNGFNIRRVKFNRSKSSVLTMDGGDVGKSARYDIINECIFQGRPSHPQVDLLTSGGTGLVSGTSYSYAVAWRDLDLAYYESATAATVGTTATVTLGGSDVCDFVAGEVVTIQGASVAAYNGRFTVVSATTTSFTFTLGGSPASATGLTVVGPGTTRPSDITTPVTPSNGVSSCKVWLPIGPYTTKARLVYRYDGTAWKLVQTVNDNTTTSWTDTGGAGTTPVFGQRSTIPHAGVQLLAAKGVIVNSNIVDGCGDPQIVGAAAQGIRVAQKQSVGCDRNIITQNIVRHSGSHGIYVIGASDNIVSANMVSNPGTVAVKAQAIRLSVSGSVNALRNLITANRCFDDQSAAHWSGGVSTSPSITISASCDNNMVVNNYLSDSAVTTSISDSGANNTVEGNSGFNAPRVAVATGAPPAATANLKNTWFIRTDLNGGTLYFYNTASTFIQVAAGVSGGGSAHIIADEGTAQTARATLDFVGAGVTVTDDSTNNKTVVTIPGGGSYTPPGAITIPFVAAAASLTWTSMPAAETEFTGQRTRTAYDLTNATDMRLAVRCITTAGVSGSLIKVQYSTAAAPTTWIDICTCPCDSLSGSAVNKGSWTAIPSGAKADVNLRLAGIGGDGATSPGFGNIIAHIR